MHEEHELGRRFLWAKSGIIYRQMKNFYFNVSYSRAICLLYQEISIETEFPRAYIRTVYLMSHLRIMPFKNVIIPV